MTSYHYRLPWPPSVNVYWRTAHKGNFSMTYLTARAKVFRSTVAAVIRQPTPLIGRLRVTLELAAPTRRKYDLDNFCKSTLDALMHAGVFADDEQIDELVVKRLHVESPGCCDVTITELTDPGSKC